MGDGLRTGDLRGIEEVLADPAASCWLKTALAAEIHQAVNLAKTSDLTILFCFDAHLYPANKQLLEAIQAAARELVVDLLRDPYDAAFLKPGVAGLTDFGWRACQIKAAIEKICASAFSN